MASRNLAKVCLQPGEQLTKVPTKKENKEQTLVKWVTLQSLAWLGGRFTLAED